MFCVLNFSMQIRQRNPKCSACILRRVFGIGGNSQAGAARALGVDPAFTKSLLGSNRVDSQRETVDEGFRKAASASNRVDEVGHSRVVCQREAVDGGFSENKVAPNEPKVGWRRRGNQNDGSGAPNGTEHVV